MRFLIDSSVLLDVLTEDPTVHGWSEEHLAERGERGALVISSIGAHDAVAGLTQVTPDPARYRTYFPKLPAIAPAG